MCLEPGLRRSWPKKHPTGLQTAQALGTIVCYNCPVAHPVRRVLCRGGPARAGLAGRLLVGSGRSPGAVVGVLVGRSSSCAYA